jgi:enoyl-CoA hydratase/carnithine racemase
MRVETQRTYRNILLHTEGDLAYVTMNRPEKRNALSLEHMEELTECFLSLGKSSQVAVVILRGNGPTFCSGHDLNELVGRSRDFYQRVFAACSSLMQTIRRIDQPVIAQVHGMATAAGCQLVAACDLAVASKEAQFATPGVRIGLFCSTPMVPISRCLPRKKLFEMLLTGEPITACEALQYGLVNRVVPAERLDEETRALAEKIASFSRSVVALGKRAFYRQLELPEELAYAYAEEVMTANAAEADAQEGMRAFLQKRPPRWPSASRTTPELEPPSSKQDT